VAIGSSFSLVISSVFLYGICDTGMLVAMRKLVKAIARACVRWWAITLSLGFRGFKGFQG